MSRVDRIKELLGWLKVLFVTLVAIDVSLIAWLAENFERVPAVRAVVALVAVVAASVGIIWVNYAVYKRIAELENL